LTGSTLCEVDCSNKNRSEIGLHIEAERATTKHMEAERILQGFFAGGRESISISRNINTYQ
jgi:hypothetical protein